MAIQDEIKEQRDKVKGQGAKALLSYFWTYYKWPTLGVIFGLALVISVVHSIVTAKDTALNAVFLNADGEVAYSDDFNHSFTQGLEQSMQVDTEKEQVQLDLSMYLSPGGASSQAEMGVTEKIIALTSAKDLDVLVADPYNFEKYALNEMFADLTQVLSDEQIAQYEPYFYYVDQKEIDKLEEADATAGTVDAADTETADAETADAETADAATADEQATAGTTTREELEAAALFDDSIAQSLTDAEKKENYVRTDPSTMEEPIAVGIYLDEASYVQNHGMYGDIVPIYGLLVNSQRQEKGLALLDYLFTTE